MYINIAVQYVRPKQLTYAREAFQDIIREIVSSEDLDLEADPSAVCLIKNNPFSLHLTGLVTDPQG